MSGAPQFPDPLGSRETYRPGATQHKAGPDLPRKVLALEQAALSRPGPGVANGSTITSDTSQTGGVAWLADQYRTIDVATARMNVNTTTGFYLNRTGTCDLFSAAGVVRALMYIDPADAGTGALAMKYKLRAWALTETNPTDSTLTVSLVRITGISGGTISAGTSALITATLSPNAANTMYDAESGDVTLTTAGMHGVVFTHSVNPAQIITYGYRLEARIG